MNTQKSLMLMFLAALVSACSTTGPTISEVLLESTGQNGGACIQQRDIRGYGVLDNNVISIDGRRNYYLATVLPGCNTLSSSPRALFEEHFGNEVCGGGSSRVHSNGEQCTIRHIFEFEDRDSAFALYEKAQEKRQEAREASHE